jgi:PAS domain S-box-containing protein
MTRMTRVLLVEDEAILAMNLEQMLRRMEYDVLALAASGEDAVALAKEHQPDIVIMDIQLAGEMDGCDAAKRIESLMDVPIVYLTGHSDDATLSKAKLTGPYAFLVKPVSQKELMICLEVALHRHEMDRKLRESEERYRNIVENINDALIIHDFAGTIHDVNENCCGMLGYARDELIGANVALFADPDSLCSRTEPMTKAGYESRVACETTFTNKDGKIIPVDVSATVVSRESGGLTQCFLRDITERKEQEQRIRKVNDSLKRTLSEKEKLYAIIGHDLKSPLIGLLAFIRMLSKKADTFSTEDLQKYVGVMQKTAEELYDLLENLLEWSRLQRGLFQCEPEPLNLAELVKQNFHLLHSLAQQKKNVMENQVPDDLVVYADNSMLKTLLRNLLTNALKFSRQGGRVLVFAERDGAMVTVAVQDEGVGMEESILAGLFKEDSIQSRKGTDGEKGTGLGLLLCAELIRQLGGDIRAQSSDGQGTTVYFTLPSGQVTS